MQSGVDLSLYKGCICIGAPCYVNQNRKGKIMTLNDEALDLYLWATQKGIVDESVEWIVETVLDQEIVSFSTSKGTVSFDVNYIEW